ncbi:MAG: Galactose/methyl galactoside import ATP-binding protein MglA [Alphaproteobacteria bacterium MarineAlpha5_Bin6]|nr:MAG: Galactose/methyl galactoside import ATP-binding protein MglA [Alphaproteobacteria bacterium MarineAlpha5_Bin7]PPR53351.1 MAG: Galactose/methyl galactoside import ATP-binding protein MglA [Alphaproteobacteria bacterium MarineAlpha5_Bin6]|tara:strand:+ start:2168 stop:3739 length:1572 start_codon:yes stop_codon:yes gene_type:complete
MSDFPHEKPALFSAGSYIEIKLKNISKKFPGVQALDDVDFFLKSNEVHALVGENGAGKSTLMKIMAGIQKPDQGKILLNNKEIQFNSPREAQNNGISIVHQEADLFPSLTVAENVFANDLPTKGFLQTVDYKKIQDQTNELLIKFGHPEINSKDIVNSLSVGQRQIVEIIKALSLNSNIIIFDEPTAVLTPSETDILFSIIEDLKKNNIAIAYISHRLEEIGKISDYVTVLKDGKHMATKEIQNINPEEMIKLMVGRDLKHIFEDEDREISNDILFEVQNLKNSQFFEDISFNIKKGEIVGFSGLIGAGRTELALTLFGFYQSEGGKVILDGKEININNPTEAIDSGIVYVSEERREKGLFTEMTVRNNLISPNLDLVAKNGILNNSQINELTQKSIDQLNIKTNSDETYVLKLSGGNQQKIALGKWLPKNPKLLIIDEPTRGVDVGAKQEVYKIIRELSNQGTSIMLISSELPEIIGICDRTIVMRSGRIHGEISKKDFSEELILKYASGYSGQSKNNQMEI